MKSIARTTLAVLIALAAAQATAEAQDTKKKPSRNRDKIESEELRSQPSTNLYSMIRSKRPHWLNTRGLSNYATTSGVGMDNSSVSGAAEPEIVVYVDHAKFGSQSILRSLQTDDVELVEYLNSASATQRFGTGHVHGAIVITRRKTN